MTSLLDEVARLSDPKKNLLTHNECELIYLCRRLAAELTRVTALRATDEQTKQQQEYIDYLLRCNAVLISTNVNLSARANAAETNVSILQAELNRRP